MSGTNPNIPACSCCGKPGNKVDKLIQIAEDFYICNNCVEICVNMIVKDNGLPLATRFIRGILNMEPSAYAMCQAEARKAAATEMLRETGAPAASYEGPLPTPEEVSSMDLTLTFKSAKNFFIPCHLPVPERPLPDCHRRAPRPWNRPAPAARPG